VLPPRSLRLCVVSVTSWIVFESPEKRRSTNAYESTRRIPQSRRERGGSAETKI
jgi:hypothetical protein